MKNLIIVGAVVLFTIAVGGSLVCAADNAVPPAAASRGRSISEFLTPDGRFDLEVARKSGYQGPLNLQAARLQIDPRTGAPRVHPSALVTPSDDPDDVYWDNTISPSVELGVNGEISALTIYDGKLVAGGFFTSAGGVVAYCIAAWDGSAWSPVGSGIMGGVNELIVFDAKLIAVGVFSMAGDVVVNNIACWDGNTWSSLGSGTNGDVYTAAVFGGRVIVGGKFSVCGGVPASKVAAWDGSSWSPLGLGVGWEVYSLCEFDGQLIAGGDFTSAGGVPAMCIASWNGSGWSPLGSGMGGGEPFVPYVDALAVFDGKLIAGGTFTTAGNVAASGIASWDGSTWLPLGSGMEDGQFVRVGSLIVYDGKLYVGGSFASAGGVLANCIASWDGSSWSPLGSGLNYAVEALAPYNGNLVVGGRFTVAGSKSSYYLAQWTKHNTCCSGRVGNANGLDGDEPSIGDISLMIDAKYISYSCDALPCISEADVNQSGGANPTCDDISIGDISLLIDYLFITGPSLGLPNCL